MAAVFLSYAREDRDLVAWLAEHLRAQDRDVWVDLDNIPPSAKWLEEISRAIAGANAVVFVVSPDSLASEVCGRELAHAVALNKRIVPVVARDPDEDAVMPDAVGESNWIFCRDDVEREPALAQLAVALDTDFEWVKAAAHPRVRLTGLGTPRVAKLIGMLAPR